MSRPPVDNKWVAGELPARGTPRRQVSKQPSAVLVDRLDRANRKHLAGRPLSVALRAATVPHSGPRPLVLLLIALGAALLVSAIITGTSFLPLAGGVVALAAGILLWWRQRAAPTESPIACAEELQRDAALLDEYLASISQHLPPAALTTLARIKELLAETIAALATADRNGLDVPVEETFFAQALVSRYLPDACRHYVEAVRLAKGSVTLENGSSADESLCRQLGILQRRLEKTSAQITAEQAQALARHEAFLKSKE